MKSCDALRRLIVLQDGILACLERTCRLVRTRGAGAQPDLARARWEMMRLLREYQLFKHHEIFDPAIAAGDPARATQAEAMKARCVVAGEAFTGHVRQWSGTAVERQWSAYEAALLQLMTALDRHIRRERREVEGLLRGTVRTWEAGRHGGRREGAGASGSA